MVCYVCIYQLIQAIHFNYYFRECVFSVWLLATFAVLVQCVRIASIHGFPIQISQSIICNLWKLAVLVFIMAEKLL